GKQMATASTDQTVRLWDASPGGEVFTLSANGPYNIPSYSPDGTRIATYVGHTAEVVDAHTGEELLSFPLPGTPGEIVYSPDGTRLLGSGDAARIWDANTGALLMTLQGHDGGIHEIRYSPDGTRIATGGKDKIVRIWDAVTGQVL